MRAVRRSLRRGEGVGAGDGPRAGAHEGDRYSRGSRRSPRRPDR